MQCLGSPGTNLPCFPGMGPPCRVLQECKVTRKYGVESSTTITLLDPAAFFAAAVEPSKPKAAPANSTTGKRRVSQRQLLWRGCLTALWHAVPAH